MASTIIKLNLNTIDLCERELEIIKLLSYGLENQQIADTLMISIHTVKAQISGILKKLKSKNRTQAVSVALRNNIIK